MLSVVVFSAAYVVAGIALGRMRRVFERSRIADGETSRSHENQPGDVADPGDRDRFVPPRTF